MAATGDPPPTPPLSSTDRLQAYRTKRSLDRSPEPSGAAVRPGGRLFVMHKHAASHLHWDFRLEMDGVLVSWAVPKGPSYDIADKRLAVHVEDHPLEYGDFEGRIPEGNYGAGGVIIWDRGNWVPLEDPAEGLEKGKLLFELQGYKLRGRWTLVKIKKAEREWLLIKERDGWMVEGGKKFFEGSILSGLLAEEVKAGADPAESIRESLRTLGAPRRSAALTDFRPMLAEPREDAFDDPAWLFELKLDGYRVLAAREDGTPRLITRNGRDATATFPEIARAVGALPYRGIVLDGEVVAVDESGRPSFQRLQQRAQFLRPIDVRRAALELPVTYYAFDLLAFEEWDLRSLPLRDRKAILRQVLPPVGPLPMLDHFEQHGQRLYEEVRKIRLEGIMAKRADAPYRDGRSATWLKIRVDRTGDFVVVGFTAPRGSRRGVGALHLADWAGGALTYAGRVGSGFTDNELDALRDALAAEGVDDVPCVGPVPSDPETTWVRPSVVVEVRYKEWTGDGLLRHPVFLRFRDDKPAAECVREGLRVGEEEPPPLQPDPPVQRTVRFSNLDKMFWPEEGFTKGDLVEYYRAIAPWILRYLVDRPVVLTRYPDGVNGKSFFQKDAPKFAPEWFRREVMWSEQAQREISYFVCEDTAGLLYIANMASIPLHVWASKVATLERPDWCVIDLDPKEAPFTAVVTIARALHALCEEIGCPSYVKTTGSTGLHVFLPVGRQLTHEQSRTLGELVSRVIAAEQHALGTITRVIERREGKVYLDYLQNGHGKLIVSPFSVRPVPGALVSMPLEWDEVDEGLDLKNYNIKTAPERMASLGRDPMLPVLSDAPDLLGILGRLQERLGSVVPPPGG